jgi:hypothetical protein
LGHKSRPTTAWGRFAGPAAFLLAAILSAAESRPRVLVSTDIGGTDPDDFQSMVHLMVYADRFDIEGIVSSPYGPGRLEHILEVVDLYARDYANLRTYSRKYPAPKTLRAMSKQGAIEGNGPAGFGKATEGSDWIVRCARRRDPRPLYVLVWGGIEDLAQALHDAPDILPKLRVYFIGGPNKMWSVDAYNYIEQIHPKLWMIEANATYRGWFTGGNQAGEWGNRAFVETHVAGRGALGTFFATLLHGTLKMGDSPSVGWLLHDTPGDPSKPGWGGQFVRVWDGRKTVFDRLTTEADQAEVFGVIEFRATRMVFDNRVPAHFRFSPRDAKVWKYTLDGEPGSFTAVPPPPERTSHPSKLHSNWWIDDPSPDAAEGVHPGAKHVSRWREQYLRDFAERMLRCQRASYSGTSDSPRRRRGR